jgi:hypothetical protein
MKLRVLCLHIFLTKNKKKATPPMGNITTNPNI